MRSLSLPVGMICASLATSAEAAPRQVVLAPPGTEVAIRAYGLGLLPFDGTFARFRGSLTYDPDDHSTCKVDLTIETASLAMSNTTVHDNMVGPDFMDAAHFPTLTYTGACQAQGLAGMLGLRGVTRPFELALDWSAGRVVAEGHLIRADWGMTAMPFVAGRTVRIQVSVQLAPPAHASLE
jgi:polyisoprenoid-binding protein YceI